MPFKDREVQKAYEREKYKKNKARILELRMLRYEANKEQEAAYQKEYAKRNRRKLTTYHKKWKDNRTPEQVEKDREHIRIYKRLDYEENPEKQLARQKVYYAVRTRKLRRPNACSKCGKKCKPQAHHADYSLPLEVVWLCGPCHRKTHLS